MSILDNPPLREQLGAWSNGTAMTPGEYDAASQWDENYRYELINGRLIVSPPAGPGERGPNALLGHMLYSYQDSHAEGSSLDEALPEQEIKIGADRRRADHAIWAGFGRAIAPLDDTPTIAVEFVSSTKRDQHRDYVEKRAEYAKAGVKEYWVIDRFRREMTIFRGAEEMVSIAECESYSTPLLPGFELPLSKLLAKADQYVDRDNPA